MCTYIPHFSLKTISLKDVLVSTSGTDTYVMECDVGFNLNLLNNNDPFTQSSDGWSITNTCSGGQIGRADHRYSPSSFKSHVAGYQYLWMAKELKKTSTVLHL